MAQRGAQVGPWRPACPTVATLPRSRHATHTQRRPDRPFIVHRARRAGIRSGRLEPSSRANSDPSPMDQTATTRVASAAARTHLRPRSLIACMAGRPRPLRRSAARPDLATHRGQGSTIERRPAFHDVRRAPPASMCPLKHIRCQVLHTPLAGYTAGHVRWLLGAARTGCDTARSPSAPWLPRRAGARGR
jgi:hypothetical protein